MSGQVRAGDGGELVLLAAAEGLVRSEHVGRPDPTGVVRDLGVVAPPNSQPDVSKGERTQRTEKLPPLYMYIYMPVL